MANQLTLDKKIKEEFTAAKIGESYTTDDGVTAIYQGTDQTADMIEDLARDFPEFVNKANAAAMLANPLGFVPPPFKLDPQIATLLGGNVAGAAAGAVAGVAGALGGAAAGAAAGVAGALGGAAAGAVAGAAGAAAAAIGGLASGFLPPGLDGPVEAVKSVIKGVTGAMPGISGSAASIVGKIGQVNALMNLALKGPGSLIFKAIGSNFLSDIPGLDALKDVVNLQSQVAGLAKLASNPLGFAAQAALMQTQFPMIDMNAMANKMIGGALSGVGFDIKSMVPNMNLAAGALSLLPIPGKTPTLNAMKPPKTANPPKPVKALEMKNLFAESAAASSLSTLKQPLSQFMGMMATIAPQTSLVAASAAATAAGTQKLVGNANSVNWGSGGYSRNTEKAEQERKRLELTAKIEKHTAELEAMVDYSKLTSMSYQDLLKKYPRITPTMSVVQALAIIDETDLDILSLITTICLIKFTV